MSKYIKGMSDPDVVWHSYFLIAWQSFYKNRAKWRRNFFYRFGNAIWLMLLKYQKIDVRSQTKIETFCIVVLLNGTNCRFVETNTKNMDTILLFLSSNGQFFVCVPKGS